MRPWNATVAVRTLGTLAALAGVAGLAVGLFMFPIAATDDELRTFLLLILTVELFIGAYLIWVGYLVWFRFSPLAVQQCCGAVGFGVLVTYCAFERQILEPQTGALVSLALMVIVLKSYQALSRYLNRILFPNR